MEVLKQLKKGDLVKVVVSARPYSYGGITDPSFIIQEETYTAKVTRNNPKTVSLVRIDGYMKGCGFRITKDSSFPFMTVEKIGESK